jgi:predicted nucleic-acid-binding protein
MVNEYLVGLLETILGKGKETSKGNYAFYCPKCRHPKQKLEVNCIITTDRKNPFHCWTCDNFKGTTIKSLFISLNISSDKYEELNTILGTSYKYSKEELKQVITQIELPTEFQPFINLDKRNIIGRHALTYLIKDRKITFEDIIKHNIGFCETGQYRGKIIIPSYSKKGKVDYFVARAFDDSSRKMDAPKSDKNFIGFESMINWSQPIIICEGCFDAISAKRNAIPLFGKSIPPKLKEQLMLNRVKQIYLSLDEDALKTTIRISEELLGLGKELYVVRLDGNDINEVGFKHYTEIIQNSKPFTLSDLIKLKMEI